MTLNKVQFCVPKIKPVLMVNQLMNDHYIALALCHKMV